MLGGLDGKPLLLVATLIELGTMLELRSMLEVDVAAFAEDSCCELSTDAPLSGGNGVLMYAVSLLAILMMSAA